MAAMPALATLLLLAGCIPSAPAPTPETAPTAVKTAPVAAATPAKPSVQTQALPPDGAGKPRASLTIDTDAKPNVSVTVEPKKDGAGFNVMGTFNLSGAIVPSGPGKWKFTGQFSMAEPDFAIGTPTTSTMGTLSPTGNGIGMSVGEDAAIVIIAIPVRPPSARAPEGTAPRSIPVSLDLDAPEKAQFTVSLTQM